MGSGKSGKSGKARRTPLYGKDFAAVYNERWAFWAAKMWPFLEETVAREVPGARRWLDLCCGTGSLLQRACRAGFDATGVDVSHHQLRWARRNAPAARLVRQDARQLSLDERFDIITCLFDSLNYLTRKRDLLSAFRRVKRHLRTGGLFIFDINTYEGLEDTWCKTSMTDEPNLTLILASSFDARTALGRLLITGFRRDGRTYRKFQEEHVERGYRAQEIEGLLTLSSFYFRVRDGNTLGRRKKRSGRLLYLCRVTRPQ